MGHEDAATVSASRRDATINIVKTIKPNIMKNIIRTTLTLIATLIATNGGFAQTSEWTEYCRLRDEINHNDSLSQEAIFRMYCRMDSIYNGIPAYSDLSGFLKIAVACNEQEKMKELAFRIVR